MSEEMIVPEPATEAPIEAVIERDMGDLVDRLAANPRAKIDPRAWQQLLIYADLRHLFEVAIMSEREACAKACEQQAQEFLSPEYATNQPLSSLSERFACGRCADAIRARSDT